MSPPQLPPSFNRAIKMRVSELIRLLHEMPHEADVDLEVMNAAGEFEEAAWSHIHSVALRADGVVIIRANP